MCWFFIVIKLLILKILLAGLTGLTTASRYDYGYHPSAEEFDNLLRETRRTWTHTFLKAERDRLLTSPTQRPYIAIENRAKSEARRHFVPKFQYDNEKKFNQFIQNPLPNKHQYDLQQASSQKHPVVPLQNIGSSLDFNYFSNEESESAFNTPQSIKHSLIRQPPVPTTTTKPIMDIKPFTPALPEINLKPIAKPDILNSNKYSLNNLYRNNSQGHFPIYFTNPATGIVYAITEVGKSTENVTRTNGTIPIFITKEQYERDIFQLKNEYEQKCQNFQHSTTTRPQIIKIQNSPTSLLTTKFSPLTSASTNPLKKPSPVVIKTQLTVKDKKTTTVRPLRKKKKKTKLKRKIKKQNTPGRKTVATTIRPISPNHPQGPAIIMGSRTTTRKPLTNTEKLPTQLEKPNFDNIFSSAVAPQTASLPAGSLNPNLFINNHRVNKRSAKEEIKSFEFKEIILKDQKEHIDTQLKPPTLATKFTNKSSILTELLLRKDTENNKSKKTLDNFNIFNTENLVNNFNNSKNSLETKQNLKSDFQMPNFKTSLKISSDLNATILFQNLTNKNLKNLKIKENYLQNSLINKTLNTKHLLNKRSLPKFIKKSTINETETNNTITNSDQQRSLKSYVKPSTTNINLKSENKSKVNITNSGKRSLKRVKHLKKRKRLSKMKVNKNSKLKQNSTKTNAIPNLTTTPRTVKQGTRTSNNKNKKIEKKSERQQDTEYYFFGIGENYDDDDDEEEEDEDDDDDDDYEDEEEDDKDNGEILAYDYEESGVPHTSEVSLSLEDLSEKPTQETSSSPEEEADIGAVEIERVDIKTPVLDYDNSGPLSLKTKSAYIKKRIRRRPPQFKIDDDYEDDDDDSSMSANLGGFFRMIFYPIQVVMTSVMDSIGGKNADEEEDDPAFNPYTQYTSYHNTLKQHSSDEYDEDYDSNESAGSSLSSWLSSWFGLNRRNKKIGSTTVAPIKVKPTKSSTSWLSSWLGFGANDKVSTDAASTEDYDEYDKWFASWFGETKPKARKRTTTTTSTTTQIPHVPILTIVDPMKNPQNWIGILAHHIINHTSTSTANPLKDIWNQVTSTTTENPEIPRKISYDKYQIWRLKPQDDSQVKALEEYKKSEDGIKLQWLKGPSLRGLTDVLVPPKMLVDFQASLTFELIDHEVLIFDVGKAIAYEKTKEDYFFTTTQKPKKHLSKTPPITGMTWHKYYEYDDIIKFLETMRMRFPHLVELIHIGRSYEGRPLIVMKIESKEAAAVNTAHYPAHQRNKLRHKKRIGLANAVFIEAGTHGMEWIGPATATWIINELLRIMKKNITDDQSFIRNTTWYIMPVLNPDGYVYSHEYDRFWKKSRSRHISRPSGILNSAMTWLQKKRTKEKVCFGVDLDRNWHYQWGKRGSSKTPCNEFYAGPTPFSEPETKALSEFLMDYRTQIKLFVSMQAYGQIISYPYKANTTYDSERLDDLLDVAMVGTDGLRKKGSKSRYKIDSSNDLIENKSGCSDAFAAYEAGIPFSYTLQLADNGVHGYLLPSASIESTAKDSFEIITGMLDYI
ncbi:uncharacterized protein LOC111675157 [Lucilia cuprina]|uniref:uncharacterized protein LOC111675157 n=1 Tax=Lucilia cuprina TaxID=7375 RepID=UPI001F05320C|nr:uncharacterized protein LOC111675157 [Lucilia cuprina]